MVEKYVQKYGEEYRALIVDALKFLEERETQWDLEEGIDIDLYIDECVFHAKIGL